MSWRVGTRPISSSRAHVHLPFAQCNAAATLSLSSLERKGERMSDALIEKIVSDLRTFPGAIASSSAPSRSTSRFSTHGCSTWDQFKTRLPNAGVTLTSNASPITERTLDRLSKYPDLGLPLDFLQ